MSTPADCRFLESHEWHRKDGDLVVLGISRFAVDELTDVTFVQLPTPGQAVSAGQSIGEIESVKATSDLYTGVGGTVEAVNDAVADDPAIINRDPFHEGWLVKIRPSNPAELNSLMDAATYDGKYKTH